MVRALGEPVPGCPDLLAPPTPVVLGAMAYHEFHRFGIERQRAQYLIAAARRLGDRQHLVDADIDTALAVLRAVPGVGPWTASYLALQTWGSADSVILGDDGIPSLVAWLLAREPRADDARLLTLLEPYRPHRGRVIQLAYLSGVRPPRRAPRARRIDIRGH